MHIFIFKTSCYIKLFHSVYLITVFKQSCCSLLDCKGNGKVHPRIGHEGPKGR